VSGSRALPLPSNRTSTSRRAFPIKVRQFRSLRYSFAIVAVNGRRVPVYVYTTRRHKLTRIGAVYLNRKRFRASVDLRGRVRGTYRVRVTAVTTTAKSSSPRADTGPARAGSPAAFHPSSWLIPL
jgi:hypothetical protein